MTPNESIPEEIVHRRIAFYGTLRSDCGGTVEARLRTGLKLQGRCEIPGKLLLVKPAPDESYPGLVSGEGTVIGELYELPEKMNFTDLDEHEGNEFKRRLVRLQEPDLDCWVYIYIGSRKRKPAIVGGDWAKR